MDDSLLSGDAVERSRLVGVTELWLPPRQVPRLIGLVPIGFGLFGVVFLVGWVGGVLGGGGGAQPAPIRVFTLLMAATTLPGFVVCAGFMALGVGILSGAWRSGVLIDETRVRVRERAGPVRWTRSARRDRLVALVMGDTGEDGLRLRRSPGADLRFAFAYPAPLARALGLALQRELAQDGTILAVEDPAGEPVAGLPAPSPDAPGPDGIEVEATGDGGTIVLPPRGMWRTPLPFAVVWLLMIGAFSVMSVRSMIDGTMEPKGSGPWALLFLLPFWAVGLGVLAYSLHLGRRRVVLRLDHQELRVEETSPVRSRVRRIPRAAIAAVVEREERGAGSDRLPAVLTVHAAGREEAIPWNAGNAALVHAARRLRQWLRLKPDAPDEHVPVVPPPDAHAPLPALSAVRVESGPGGLVIELPPRGLVGAGGSMAVIGGFFVLFTGGMAVFWSRLESSRAWSDLTIPVAVFGLFGAVGIALLISALWMGTRRVRLSVADGALEVESANIAQRRHWHLRADQVATVRVEPSGISVNHRPLLRLAIVRRDGEDIRLGVGRTGPELLAVAARLRAALGQGV